MKRVVLKTNETVAYQGGAMESGDHFKNGASSKSQRSRGNIANKSAYIINFFIFICLIIITSCDKDKDNGIFTLTSDDMKGFSFKSLKYISFPFSDNQMPDFIVFAHQDETGKIISPSLASPSLERKFALVDDFENFEIALQTFESYESEDNYIFDMFALPVRPNQIWLVKIESENYGIVLITSSDFYEKKDKTPYAKVSFMAKKI